MNALVRVAQLATLSLFVACGSGPGARTGSSEPAPSRRTDAVTMEELSRVAAFQDLYDALRSLRPMWFRTSPSAIHPSAESGLQVYLDGVRLGGLETLRQIRVASVVVVRYFTPSEAEARFGGGNLQGAILVTTSTTR